ncbi:MAG: metallophosphoesterase family protein [Armatimonadetes bacterium]|nr:metallophosphoesterase family protein [Armatimonadota bacterium]
MRVAIVSDMHGNLRALEAVLAGVAQDGADAVVVAGDLAMGGPQPAECVARVRGLNCPVIRGNTDEWIGRGAGPTAAIQPVVDWARMRLSAEDIACLGSLPMDHRIRDAGGDLVVVHATPWSVEERLDPDAPEEEAERALDAVGARVLVYGHIHIAYRRDVGGRLVVNVGSVGFPFDGDPRASYGLFTLHGGRWEAVLRRVEYDREAVAQDLLASDHPAKEAWAKRVRLARP